MTCPPGQGSPLGDLAAGLVDGELDHAARERAQSHLLHCDDCRSEVEAQRRLKTRLAGLSPVAPSADLTARLLAMTVPGTQPARGPLPVGPVRPAAIRVGARPGGSSGPPGASGPGVSGVRRTTRPRARRATMGSALAVLGVGVLIALGGPRGGSGITPVDPGGDGFVVDYVNRTVEVTVEPAGFTAGDLLP